MELLLKNKLVCEVKQIIIDVIMYTKDDLDVNFSEYLSKKFDYNYNYLNDIFKKITGICISDFIIEVKIDKAKELIIEKSSFKEIAYKLGYSSPAHFSHQFKFKTGFTPLQFKNTNIKDVHID